MFILLRNKIYTVKPRYIADIYILMFDYYSNNSLNYNINIRYMRIVSLTVVDYSPSIDEYIHLLDIITYLTVSLNHLKNTLSFHTFLRCTTIPSYIHY